MKDLASQQNFKNLLFVIIIFSFVRKTHFDACNNDNYPVVWWIGTWGSRIPDIEVTEVIVCTLATLLEPSVVATGVVRHEVQHKLHTWKRALCYWCIVDIVKCYVDRADSRFVPSQWETALLCNVSHWLGASLESALCGLLRETKICPSHPSSTYSKTLKYATYPDEADFIKYQG